MQDALGNTNKLSRNIVLNPGQTTVLWIHAPDESNLPQNAATLGDNLIGTVTFRKFEVRFVLIVDKIYSLSFQQIHIPFVRVKKVFMTVKMFSSLLVDVSFIVALSLSLFQRLHRLLHKHHPIVRYRSSFFSFESRLTSILIGFVLQILHNFQPNLCLIEWKKLFKMLHSSFFKT